MRKESNKINQKEKELNESYIDDITNMLDQTAIAMGLSSLKDIESDMKTDYMQHIKSENSVKQQILSFDFDQRLQESSDIKDFIKEQVKSGVSFKSKNIVNFCAENNIESLALPPQREEIKISSFVKRHLIR
jgi:hypothetical protein